MGVYHANGIAYLFQDCARHCSICEGDDHHWTPECDDETGEPVMACKHCDAVRPYADEDDAE